MATGEPGARPQPRLLTRGGAELPHKHSSPPALQAGAGSRGVLPPPREGWSLATRSAEHSGGFEEGAPAGYEKCSVAQAGKIKKGWGWGGQASSEITDRCREI